MCEVFLNGEGEPQMKTPNHHSMKTAVLRLRSEEGTHGFEEEKTPCRLWTLLSEPGADPGGRAGRENLAACWGCRLLEPRQRRRAAAAAQPSLLPGTGQGSSPRWEGRGEEAPPSSKAT